MHYVQEHVILFAKTLGVGVLSGISALGGVIVAQAQQVVPEAGSGGVTVILAVAVASTLGSMVYLFQLDKKNAHELKLAEQTTRQKELENEAQKSSIAAKDRKSREDALMELAMTAQKNLETCSAERRILQERVTYLLERSGPLESHESITDTETRKRFIDPSA